MKNDFDIRFKCLEMAERTDPLRVLKAAQEFYEFVTAKSFDLTDEQQKILDDMWAVKGGQPKEMNELIEEAENKGISLIWRTLALESYKRRTLETVVLSDYPKIDYKEKILNALRAMEKNHIEFYERYDPRYARANDFPPEHYHAVVKGISMAIDVVKNL